MRLEFWGTCLGSITGMCSHQFCTISHSPWDGKITEYKNVSRHMCWPVLYHFPFPLGRVKSPSVKMGIERESVATVPGDCSKSGAAIEPLSHGQHEGSRGHKTERRSLLEDYTGGGRGHRRCVWWRLVAAMSSGARKHRDLDRKCFDRRRTVDAEEYVVVRPVTVAISY